VADFNRRFTNRVSRHVAPWAPGFALVRHVGRRSGRVYETPVNVFRDRDGGGGYAFALTYGATAEWVRNVLAAGSCQIRTRGKMVTLTDPSVLADPTRSRAPALVRPILGLVEVTGFLVLRAAGAGDEQ
jgi:deazaflavin-dependent oxidoreductase (nitroreductase family)